LQLLGTGATISSNIAGSLSFAGASVLNSLTGATLNLSAAGGVTSSAAITLPSGFATLTSTNAGHTGGAIQTLSIDVSGFGGAGGTSTNGANGGNAGNIQLTADGLVQTQSLRA